MRCAAYCTASSYDLQGLLNNLLGGSSSTLYEGSLHFRIRDGDVFFFSFGSVVFWNFSEIEEHEILKKGKAFEKDSLLRMEFDEFSFEYGKPAKVFQDQIILEHPEDILSKLSVSHGLAQSLKLIFFETRIETVIEGVEKITEAMARQGKVPLSRREIGKKIGKLFFERNSINLHSDFLNPPDFFWEYPELEPLYQLTVKDLEIRSRTQTLNRKLDIMHDLYQILGDELNHRHTAKLEWIIIILIMIEVLLAISNKVELFWKW
jgi:uncharacterized Rmd1/YagE family protein